MPASIRREKLLDVIRKREFARVGELSETFGVSEVTVRSDLDVLAKRGLVHRLRGGAVPRVLPHEERPFEETRTAFAAEKAAIARAVVDRLADRESVILDVGSTAAAVARELVARPTPRELVIFTNSLATALELEPAIPHHNIVVLGGTLRGLQHSLVDPMLAPTLEQLNVDTVVLGCNGVDAEAGITNINLPEAEVKRRMVRVAGRRIVVADGSKLGRVELVRFAPVDEIDMIVTGQSADEDVVEALRAAGVEVVVAT